MIAETYHVGEFLVEVYDNPSVNLSLPAQQRLIREFTPVADNGFDKHHFDEEVVRRHFLSTSTTIVIREANGQVGGFAGSSILDIDEYKVIYLQGGTITKSCRNRSLYNIVIGARIMADIRKINKDDVENKKVLIAGRTQNPLVYKFLHRKLGFFPYPDSYIRETLKSKAKKIAQKIYEDFSDFQSSEGCLFDPDVFVLRRSFGLMSGGEEFGYNLYGNHIPFCKDDDAINEYMMKNLNWHNGDALIMIGDYCRQDVMSLFHGQRIGLRLPVAA